MHIDPPLYRFCPLCATPLALRLDSDGQTRQACPACLWIYYPHSATSVAGVLFQGDQVLLVRRASPPCTGTWLFPSGFVSFGEHPQAAMCREFLEETGLTVAPHALLHMGISTEDPREPGHLTLFFHATLVSGTLYNADNENLDVGWFPLAQLPPIQLQHHRLVADSLLDRQLPSL